MIKVFVKTLLAIVALTASAAKANAIKISKISSVDLKNKNK